MSTRKNVLYRSVRGNVTLFPFLRFPLPGTLLLTFFVFFLVRGLLPMQESYRIFKIFQHHITKHAVVSATKAKVIIAFQTSKHHVKGARWRASAPLLTLVTGFCHGCWMTPSVVSTAAKMVQFFCGSGLAVDPVVLFDPTGTFSVRGMLGVYCRVYCICLNNEWF